MCTVAIIYQGNKIIQNFRETTIRDEKTQFKIPTLTFPFSEKGTVLDLHSGKGFLCQKQLFQQSVYKCGHSKT